MPESRMSLFTIILAALMVGRMFQPLTDQAGELMWRGLSLATTKCHALVKNHKS